MNFLAHQYLSGNNEGLRIGNFIGDFVKGNSWQNYPSDIQLGILLHRSIDDFTDHHEIVKESVSFLKPSLGRYSSIANDIFFDHFLAKQWGDYSSEFLDDFACNTYLIINKSLEILPEKTAYVLQYMENQNWLVNYQFINGIEKTMKGMSRRTQQPLLENSHLTLIENYDAIKNCFDIFFPLLRNHVAEYLLIKKSSINV